MDKRAIWLPFIFIYKTLFYLFKTPIMLIKYFTIGCYFFLWVIFKYLFFNALKGFTYILFIIIKFFLSFCYYLFKGLKVFLKIIFIVLKKILIFLLYICRYFYLGLKTPTLLFKSSNKKSKKVKDIKVGTKSITNPKKDIPAFTKKPERYNQIPVKVVPKPIKPRKFKNLGKRLLLFLPLKTFRFIKYIFIGVIFVLYLFYRLIRYFFIGFFLPFRIILRFIGNPLQNLIIKQLKVSKIKKEENAVQKFLEKKERDRLKFEQIKAKEERLKKRTKEKRNRSLVIAKVEKVSFDQQLKNFFKQIRMIPERIKSRLKEETKFSPLAQAFSNDRKLPARKMVIDYEGIDAIKSKEKLLYEYVVRNPQTEKIIKGYFDAFSIVEVHSFLISEGYEVYSIKTSALIRLIHFNVSVSKRKIKISDLIFMLTQLSTYIKAGLPLSDSLNVLAKQYQKSKYFLIFKAIIYDLTMGENFSTALAKQGHAFPRLLINMVKTAEMTGELPETLDDMVEYYTEIEQTRKQMISALTYPTIVLVMAIGVLSFIMVFVVPKFVDIYQTMDNAEIPLFTIFIMNASKFMQNNIVQIAIVIVVLVLLLRYLYTNVKFFRYIFQWIFMHIPVIGNILIYNEVTMFTKTFSSLLSHNVFITDSMEILNRVTNNEVYKILISKTIENLNLGERISLAFENAWAFPIPAYEMLVTGEKTGQLPEMMGKVSTYYQDLHRNSVAKLKSLIEPFLIIFLTAVVGVIIMAVIVPMFNMYSSISGYGGY